jgi:hypothetical protein
VKLGRPAGRMNVQLGQREQRRVDLEMMPALFDEMLFTGAKTDGGFVRVCWTFAQAI